MIEEIVDSNVFIGALLNEDEHYTKAISLVEDLNDEKRLFHISMLVPAEVCGAIIRRTKSKTQAYCAKRTLDDWIKDGKLTLYELNQQRMDRANEIAIRDVLKGPDAVIVQISEELKLPLRTFDKELLERFKGEKL